MHPDWKKGRHKLMPKRFDLEALQRDVNYRLEVAEKLLEDARDHIMGFIGSSYSETDKEDEAFVDEIDTFLGNKLVDWRNINS